MIRAAVLVVVALAGGYLAVFASSNTSEPTAQEIADRHNRVIEEALTHEKEDMGAVVKLLSAISRSEAQDFVTRSDAEWLRPKLNKGWEVALLGYLRKDGERTGLWAVSFDDGGDDVVAKLSVRDGKIAAFSVK